MHSLDEQPPPPGDDTDLPVLQPVRKVEEHFDSDSKKTSEDASVANSEMNGGSTSKVDGESRKEGDSRKDKDSHKDSEHHHHKKSRGGTSSDDKKVRDKKKRKKSKEHEKKKSKKDRKDRDKEKEKKSTSKTGSVDKTPDAPPGVAEEVAKLENLEEEAAAVAESVMGDIESSFNDRDLTPERHDEPIKAGFKRSDSFLDINPNVDLEFDDWVAPEVSKWERDENKSTASADNSELDLGNGDLKKNPEEKVTTEILKRAENAIFARAISAIRPVENKKVKTVQDQDSGFKRSTSPIMSSSKRLESSKDSKIQAFQVTVPANESGARSVEMKTSERSRKTPPKTSIKNRLGVKIVEKRSRTPSRSPKRRLQSEGTKIVRSSRDHSGRAQQNERSGRDRHQTPENRRNKPLSSCVKVSNDSRDSRNARRGNSRSRPVDKRRSLTPVDRRAPPKRIRSSRSRSNSRHRRPVRKPSAERQPVKAREPRNDERAPKPAERSPSDNRKSKAESSQHVEAAVEKKKSRDSSSSSSASSTASGGSQKHSKRHAKHKVKKRSRSPSVDSGKRKKSKKKSKKKKSKSSRK